jgi:serine protease Do
VGPRGRQSARRKTHVHRDAGHRQREGPLGARPAWRSQQSSLDFIQTERRSIRGTPVVPLVNVRGEVIGINSAIESPNGLQRGTASPCPHQSGACGVERSSRRRVERAALGISVRDAGVDDAAYAGLEGHQRCRRARISRTRRRPRSAPALSLAT